MEVGMRCSGCSSPRLAARVTVDGELPRGVVPDDTFTHRADEDLIAELAQRPLPLRCRRRLTTVPSTFYVPERTMRGSTSTRS